MVIDLKEREHRKAGNESWLCNKSALPACWCAQTVANICKEQQLCIATNQLNIRLVTYVLTRVETASAMAMVTASSLLIGNLLLLPELCAVSSSSSVSFMVTSAHAICLKGSASHKVWNTIFIQETIERHPSWAQIPPASIAPVDLVLGELGGVGGVVWLACAEFAASLPVKKY